MFGCHVLTRILKRLPKAALHAKLWRICRQFHLCIHGPGPQRHSRECKLILLVLSREIVLDHGRCTLQMVGSVWNGFYHGWQHHCCPGTCFCITWTTTFIGIEQWSTVHCRRIQAVPDSERSYVRTSIVPPTIQILTAWLNALSRRSKQPCMWRNKKVFTKSCIYLIFSWLIVPRPMLLPSVLLASCSYSKSCALGLICCDIHVLIM